ncbi:hypothetical protein MPRI_00150 [Mycobacterium paraintracellulare]|uniref:Calcineurin-like phosphoesterase domain-containing protein n=1 Tax=Mycobacterium paraintracellulare TaxID=1138383 RepID=A0ABM7K1L8_9MYCO|nr:hypothetical protein MPRI_00150 [Mycobacterium paraintracellulare]
MPDSGSSPQTRGLWYSFTAGSVRVISLANDDVAYQDGGNSYVHGYSGGEQRRWLASELAASRSDPNIDWVVVCMHQTAISTADKTNGADLGIREEWLPLFDQYQVDLVLCGHEHHYERSHPVRGAGDRHPHADPRRHPKRSHRLHPGHGASGHRRRRHLGAEQRNVLSRTPVPGGHRRGGVRPSGCGARRRSTSSRTRRGRRSATATTLTASRLSTSTGPPGGNTSIKATHYALGPAGRHGRDRRIHPDQAAPRQKLAQNNVS